MSTRQLIESCLKEVMVLQIATSVNNVPWICTVCFAYDSSFHLYWFSRHNTRHSQEIARNPQVGAAVSMPYALGVKPRGLQFTGRASMLEDKKNIAIGLEAMQKRYGVKPTRLQQLTQELFSKSADYGLYCLYPKEIILYDTLTFPDSPRQVYTVSSKPSKK